MTSSPEDRTDHVPADPPSDRSPARRAGRVLDAAWAAVLLVLVAPVLLVVAVWIRAHDRGPVLVREPGVGPGGRRFTRLKFRSTPLHPPRDGHAPALPPPGRSIRRLYLDELPQLVNIVRGDISVVGAGSRSR